jgi:LacI family transcriptional regulator
MLQSFHQLHANRPMPRTHSKPTLRDVAIAAQVSIATASRALNGLLVSAGNQARVMRAVRELGYVANETARALRRDRSHTLGLIFYALGNARGLQLSDALSATLDAAGYSLLIATARGDERTYELLIRRFLQRRVDGLFCVSPNGEPASAELCRSAGIPVIALRSRGAAFSRIPLLEPSFASAATAATCELLALGHRRVAFMDDGSELDRSNPVIEAWSESPFKIERVQLAALNGIDQFIRRLMRVSERATVIAASEPQAEAALAVCRSLRIKVPEHVSIVAVSNAEDEPRARQLSMSSVLIDSHLLGERAGAVMLEWLAGKKPNNRKGVEIGTWHGRGTTGPAPRHAGKV